MAAPAIMLLANGCGRCPARTPPSVSAGKRYVNIIRECSRKISSQARPPPAASAGERSGSEVFLGRRVAPKPKPGGTAPEAGMKPSRNGWMAGMRDVARWCEAGEDRPGHG